MEQAHFDDLAECCARLELPRVPEGPLSLARGRIARSPARAMLYRIAQPRNLLEIALAAEWRAREFFVGIARTSPNRDVRELASVMAAEETST
jgi:hypothetical protein